MLEEGLRLMFAGMGVVFALLITMVFAVKGMSRLALSLEGPVAPGQDQEIPNGVAQEADLIAAVTAAVHAYRKSAK